MHAERPSTVLYDPGAHGCGFSLPAGHALPIVHGTATVTEIAGAQKNPAGQSVTSISPVARLDLQRLPRGQVKGVAEEVKEEVVDGSLVRVAAAEIESAAVDVPDRVETREFDGV